MAEFHIGDLLSISTGRLVSPRHVGGVYDILGHLCGEPLMTHQLPEAARIAQPYLLGQHPWLKSVVPPEQFTDEAHIWAWLAEMVAEHGEAHSVEPMPPTAWGHHDPIADLLAMTDKPVVVVLDDSAGRKGQADAD